MKKFNVPVVYNKNNGTSYIPIIILGIMEHMRDLLKESGFTPAPIQYVDFSNRMTKTLACTCEKNGEYWILFSTKFLETASEKNIREVAMHEAIHLLDGCFNHGTRFKFIAEIVNKKYGFHVATYMVDEKYKEARVQK